MAATHMALVRGHIFVRGLVQGVFFRRETARVAKMNGVKGWVRNLPDGRVEAVFEGEKEAVEKVISFCRMGPPGAVVEDVKIIWEPWLGEFKEFKIIC